MKTFGPYRQRLFHRCLLEKARFILYRLWYPDFSNIRVKDLVFGRTFVLTLEGTRYFDALGETIVRLDQRIPVKAISNRYRRRYGRGFCVIMPPLQ